MFKFESLNILPMEYSLQTVHRSNQDTSLFHRPVVTEGDWVQAGDLLADCSSSEGGEFSIGRNILIAYLPWEGYNYEDAILISERLVYDDLYTSIHVERYAIAVEPTTYGDEKITREIPQLKDMKELKHLDRNGVALLGTWLKEGDILVGKITPIEPKKNIAPYIQLYNDIMDKKLDYSVRDTSLRMPRGLEAKLIKVKLFKQKQTLDFKKSPLILSSLRSFLKINQKTLKSEDKNKLYGDDSNKFHKKYMFSQKEGNNWIKSKFNRQKLSLIKQKKPVNLDEIENVINGKSKQKSSISKKSNLLNKKRKRRKKNPKNLFYKNELISSVHVYLAEKRKLQVGDKMAGRHGNKGIISEILPRQDMPYLPDGTPLDMALNPLGVPSRMNVGQIYECLLGLAGKQLSEYYRIMPFDELYGPEASRSFVFAKLNEAKKKTGQSWLFQPSNPGKLKLFDGRNGLCFDQSITAGYSYMIKLVHLVDDKIHCLTEEHDVLTTQGWLPINKITMSHKVASLQKNGTLVYKNPFKIYHYNNFNGKIYKLKNSDVDLLVTLNHRMYVTNCKVNGYFFDNYELIPAKNLVGKCKKYLKTAYWKKEDYQFILPSFSLKSFCNSEKTFKMSTWLKFFGIWISNGLVVNNKLRIYLNSVNLKKPRFIKTSINNFFYNIEILSHKNSTTNLLLNLIKDLGYNYLIIKNKIIINDKQLWFYLKSFTMVASKKKLPAWVWELSQKQVRIFLKSIVGYAEKRVESLINYYTSSSDLADDLARLSLHAGWSGQKFLHIPAGSVTKIKNKNLMTNFDLWRIEIRQEKNNPSVNNDKSYLLEDQIEKIIQYQGPVFCLSVPNEVFYVRRNGIPVWTGNSRSTGPYSLVTQQPLKGRSKHGGQRLGEMEVWALEAYGAAFTLLELLTIKSDDVTGRLTIWDYVLYKRPLYIGTPASFKVLICELESLCLDIGIYKSDDFNILRPINVSNMG
uniref:DNA-directed RNA polymerase n=1 Tax=Aphanochaete confervicola TaxID=764104 RepID=A0A6H1XE46_9CHLO|nr:beta subunit of RNA polymerase [Aphanochaete confervicola]QJA13893.1 beta subunit of RNA polymerase [Aphanochaete confervicola]